MKKLNLKTEEQKDLFKTIYYNHILGRFVEGLDEERAKLYSSLDYLNHDVKVSIDECHYYLLITDEVFGLLIEAQYKDFGEPPMEYPVCKINVDYYNTLN